MEGFRGETEDVYSEKGEEGCGSEMPKGGGGGFLFGK